MLTLQQEIIAGLLVIESSLGNPSFTWQGNTYNFIPSVTEFKRELDIGGFMLVKLLKATVRKQDGLGNIVFATLPSPQQKIVYTMDGLTYRIETIKQDVTGAYFQMICESETKGI